MQIREMNLKELYEIYEVLKELRPTLSYDEFENLVYDMRHMDYKMFGILEKGVLITFSGVAVQTNLYHKRHLYIFDLVTKNEFRSKNYGKLMLEYLNDYAKTCMCENIVLSSNFEREDAHRFYENSEFNKKSFLFLRAVT